MGKVMSLALKTRAKLQQTMEEKLPERKVLGG